MIPRSAGVDRIRPPIWLALLVLGGPGVVGAQRAIPNGTVHTGTLSFDGRATPGDFTGTTSAVTGELVGGSSLALVRGWVEAPVATLVTGNGRRDRDLNKSMESDKYQAMRFDLTGVRSAGDDADSMAVVLEGELAIHGVTMRRELDATLLFRDDLIRVRASFPLDLRDHKIGGLSKFLGVLKMHPDILVHVDLVFLAAPPPSP